MVVNTAPLSLQHLKPLTRLEALSASIKVTGAIEIQLLPVGEWILGDQQLVTLFTRWRAESRDMYFSQFPESVEGMRRYLIEKSIGSPSYILFVIEKNAGTPLGHIGLKLLTRSTAAVDSVMKAPECKIPGLMDLCLKTLIDFAGTELEIKELQLEVVSHNTRAIKLYTSNGFKQFAVFPLQRIVDGDRIEHLRVHSDHANVDYYGISMVRKID